MCLVTALMFHVLLHFTVDLLLYVLGQVYIIPGITM